MDLSSTRLSFLVSQEGSTFIMHELWREETMGHEAFRENIAGLIFRASGPGRDLLIPRQG